ncbi:hypothetical protein FRC00_012659 [Tulasnella sp. 408]|nr:hypothetical protein FRC00_012659 [Tulasnella sp. 408]
MAFMQALESLDFQTAAKQSIPTRPVHRAPVELLYDIFEYSLDGSQGVARVQATLNLGQINRRFREVAVGNPLLWSHIVLSDSLPKEICETFLIRAADVPLHLTISFNPNCDCPLSSIPGADLVSSLSSRWATVVIRPSKTPAAPVGRNEDPSREVVAALTAAGSSALRSMEFHFCLVTNLPTDSAGACHLKSLKLFHSILNLDKHVSFPALKVMDLHLLQQDARLSCEHIINHLPVIETLSIAGNGFLIAEGQDQLSFPSLESLSVTCKDLLSGRNFIARTKAPRLRSLTLGPGGMQALRVPPGLGKYGASMLFESLDHFAWVGGTSISTDNLRWPPSGRDAFYADAIKRLSNVTSHILNDPSTRSLETAIRLSETLGAQAILPSLRALTIGYIGAYTNTSVPCNLFKLITLRKQAALPPIQHLSIHIRNTGIPRQHATREKVESIVTWMESIKLNVEWLELEGEKTEQEVYFPEEIDTEGLTELQRGILRENTLFRK